MKAYGEDLPFHLVYYAVLDNETGDWFGPMLSQLAAARRQSLLNRNGRLRRYLLLRVFPRNGRWVNYLNNVELPDRTPAVLNSRRQMKERMEGFS